MFKRLEINEERDLENLVAKDPESIEKGLIYLTHQREANRKFIDVLAVDADGVLTVIELKIGQEDEMLFQALEYYDWVSSNRDRLAKEFEKRAKIVTVEDPRIILIASGFSERLKRALRHIEPRTMLMEYAYLETKAGERGLYCQEVQFDSEDTIYAPPLQLENVLSYINQPKAREACEKIHAELCNVGKDIEPIPRDGYIRYKCKNRVVGDVSLRRTFIHVWVKLDDKWESLKVVNFRDWLSKKKKILKDFTKQYHSLGGE